MSSVHLYQAEKKDFDMIYEMLMEFKEGELFDKKLPEVDKPKVTLFILPLRKLYLVMGLYEMNIKEI